MLELSGISKAFVHGELQSWALRDVSLSVKEGDFVAVMGPSGSGKTTLLSIMGLLDEASSGELRLGGELVGRYGDSERARLRNQHIGFVFQAYNLIPDLTVAENVGLPLRYRKLRGAALRRRVTGLLEQFGLSARADHYPAQLSGGQQQRVAIARAVVGEPSLLLADEPTGNLDSLAARAVMQQLEALNQQGTTIVMVTHSQEMARYARRSLHLVDGQAAEIPVPVAWPRISNA